ncbi:MAG: ATP-binding protein [Smithellaceae bacterium]
MEQEKKTRSLLEEKETAFNQLDLLFRSIIESVDTGVMTVSLQGRIKTFNRAAEVITGLKLKAIENRKVEEIFPQFKIFFDKDSLIIEKNRREVTLHKQKDKKVHLGCSLSPLKDRYGRQIGHILIFQDLTEIKRMEEHLEKSKRLAIIGEMAAGLAHEMRNPLASITGSIQLLAQTKNLEETDRRLMQIILRGKDQLDNFVRDFLLLARPIPQIRQVVDVNEVAEETLDLISMSGEWKSQARVIKIFSQENVAFANREQIRQILQNLIINAMQAIDDQGTVSIEINTVKNEDRKPFAEITVTDDGCGIEEEDMQNVFEPFFTNKEKGTGLGLAIVSRIVDGYGGRIRMESTIDKGTSIKVWLPANPE